MNGEILFQGHGSIRITTKNEFVIYVDPFAGKGYEKNADLILVTHQHFDHNKIEKPAKKENCQIWQNTDALINGVYQTKKFGPVTVKATEAYNFNHKKEECVGFILSFDNIKLYIAGDTSKTNQMENMSEEKLDYAFLPIDGIYNMGSQEAAECAELIQAKFVIPYHMVPVDLFDRNVAETFKAENRIILEAGESIRY